MGSSEIDQRVSDLNDWVAALEGSVENLQRKVAELEKACGINVGAPTARSMRQKVAQPLLDEAAALGR